MVATLPMAVFDFLDPSRFGPSALLVVCLIVFAETGLLVGFLLPGDTLLITAGILAASSPGIGVPPVVAALLIALAAFLGGELGYFIGHRFGPRIFERRESGLFSRANVERTNAFFDRYGAIAVILARFVPIVRTFAPLAAGIGHMDPRRYSLYNAAGAILWGFGLTMLGAAIAQIEPVRVFVEQYIDLVLIIAVLLTVVPTTIHYLRARGAAKRLPPEAAPSSGGA